MAKLRIDRALSGLFPSEVEVFGSTVHACLDEVARRHGRAFAELCLDHAHGEKWRLSDRVVVRVNGADVRTMEGLSTTVALGDELDVATRAATVGPPGRA
ncbi:MAG TPA: MoaD/ThiS family protein [Candidatus Thermoplasmatota archaeon]|nr:MoaD/ThiS family protein [Candidatus Thermoplasmatota archaeon]